MDNKERLPYQSPQAVNLGDRALSGGADACLAGTSVGGFLCSVGGIDAACDAGTSGYYYLGDDCRSGATATDDYSCLSGGTADWECAAGTTPSASGPCTVGGSA